MHGCHTIAHLASGFCTVALPVGDVGGVSQCVPLLQAFLALSAIVRRIILAHNVLEGTSGCILHCLCRNVSSIRPQRVGAACWVADPGLLNFNGRHVQRAQIVPL